MWKTVASKELTREQVETLIRDGKTDVIGGFKAVRGRPLKRACGSTRSGKRCSISTKMVRTFPSNRRPEDYEQ